MHAEPHTRRAAERRPYPTCSTDMAHMGLGYLKKLLRRYSRKTLGAKQPFRAPHPDANHPTASVYAVLRRTPRAQVPRAPPCPSNAPPASRAEPPNKPATTRSRVPAARSAAPHRPACIGSDHSKSDGWTSHRDPPPPAMSRRPRPLDLPARWSPPRPP